MRIHHGRRDVCSVFYPTPRPATHSPSPHDPPSPRSPEALPRPPKSVRRRGDSGLPARFAAPLEGAKGRNEGRNPRSGLIPAPLRPYSGRAHAAQPPNHRIRHRPPGCPGPFSGTHGGPHASRSSRSRHYSRNPESDPCSNPYDEDDAAWSQLLPSSVTEIPPSASLSALTVRAPPAVSA